MKNSSSSLVLTLTLLSVIQKVKYAVVFYGNGVVYKVDVSSNDCPSMEVCEILEKSSGEICVVEYDSDPEEGEEDFHTMQIFESYEAARQNYASEHNREEASQHMDEIESSVPDGGVDEEALVCGDMDEYE